MISEAGCPVAAFPTPQMNIAPAIESKDYERGAGQSPNERRSWSQMQPIPNDDE
jgi:hypothetical protein